MLCNSSEHLGLPNVEEVVEGTIAAKLRLIALI